MAHFATSCWTAAAQSGKRAAMPAPKILAVDDNPDVLDILVAFLEEGGFAVASAGTGAAALELLREYPSIALLVTDIMMPKLSGVTLAEEALAIRPTLKILYVTAATDVVAEKARQLQGPYLLKPLRMMELVAAATDILAGRG
jgi:DNA-binding response OmpR family regulator